MVNRLLPLFACALAGACIPPPTRQYYTLTGQIPATRFEHPYSVTIRVRDLELRRTYRRDELVARTDANELTFLRSSLWSEPPQRMISALVREQLRRSGVAAEVQDDTAITEPDLVFSGEIEAIEQLAVGRERYAHLTVVYRLQSFKDSTTVWDYRIDAKRPASATSVRSIVRTMSEILATETDLAIADLGKYLADPAAGRTPAEVVPIEEPRQSAPGVLAPDASSALNNLPQLQRDDTPIPLGHGAIFAPTLSDGEREPLVGVYQNGTSVAEGKLGQRIVVPPGDYEVRVGSGAVSQQIPTNVRVLAGKTTVLPPVWAAMEVAVVDKTFVPFRGTYELIRMESRELFGLGFGADEQLGEVPRVWVLPPGLYKVIRSGGTYRDRTDFATVRLEAGRLTRFTLVVDPDTGSFLGAGENDPDPTNVIGTDEEIESPWVLRGVIGGSVNFRRTDEVGQPQGWSFGFRAFLDGSFRFLSGPHLWVTRLEMEEGQTRVFSLGRFQNDADRLFFHTIYTYRLLPWFGPYVRFGLETQLLPRYQDFDTPQDVIVLDPSGNTVQTLVGVDRVKLGSTFAPLLLKQGTGGNFRVLRSQAVELDLRLGFGARQTFANGLFAFQSDPTGGPGHLIPAVDSTVEGLEGTVVGIGRVTRFITLSTELDGLIPISSNDFAVYTWRNQVTFRLVSFISLNYRFNLTRDPNLGIGTSPRTEHDVQLRFSYVLF